MQNQYFWHLYNGWFFFEIFVRSRSIEIFIKSNDQNFSPSRYTKNLEKISHIKDIKNIYIYILHNNNNNNAEKSLTNCKKILL